MQDNAMFKLPCKFGVTKWNPYWRINELKWTQLPLIISLTSMKMLTDIGSFAIPSEIMAYQSYPESVVNQNEIPIE